MSPLDSAADNSSRAEMGSIPGVITPVGTPTPEQLSVINDRHARTPLTADGVYVFDAEISNDLVDSYYTSMADDSLRNFAMDFIEGRSLQNSHRTNELPIGRSFGARLEMRGTQGDLSDPPRTAVVVSDYIVRGIKLNEVSNDDVIRGIDAGTIRDQSIHFIGGRYECDLCGRDMMRDWDCEHFPGIEYDGKMSTATIRDSHAIEHSLVFDGATPHAMVDKARSFAERGMLTEKQLCRFEEVHHVRVRGAARTPSPAGTSTPSATRADSKHTHAVSIDEQPPSKHTHTHDDSADGHKHSKSDDNNESGKTLLAVGKEDEKSVSGAQTSIGENGDERLLLANLPEDLRHLVSEEAFAALAAEEKVRTYHRLLELAPWIGPLGERVAWALSYVATTSTTTPAATAEAGTADDTNSRTGDAIAHMEPKDFVELIVSPLAEETRARLASVMIEQAGDAIDRAFVEQVAATWVARMSTRLAPDVASKAQEALDHLANADDSHRAAVDALETLMTLGGLDPVDQPDPEPASDGTTGNGATSETIPASKANSNGHAPKNRAAETVPAVDPPSMKTAAELVDMLASDPKDDEEDTQDGGTDEDEEDDKQKAARAQRTTLLNQLRQPENAPLRAIVSQVRDGRRWRSRLIDELHEWGVRARGSKYPRDLYARVVASLGTEEIEGMRDEFEADAMRRFSNSAPGDIPEWAQQGLSRNIGRQTIPAASPYGPTATSERNGVAVDLEQFTTAPRLAPLR